MSRSQVRSWGGFPDRPQTLHGLAHRHAACEALRSIADRHGSTLPFGNGRSYGDSCLAASRHVVGTRMLDRFLAADWTTGRVAAEAGMTLAELLAVSIPRGWFLPVTPGTRFVTLGGAIANDVHGKNHHVRGTFGRHVTDFRLARSDRPSMTCSATKNAELYAATIGGLGLTGLITDASLQLMPIGSALMRMSARPFRDLAAFFELSAQLDPRHEYTVSWFDCLASGRNRGRGVHFAADHAPDGPLIAASKRCLSVPFTPPWSPVNGLTLSVFNTLYRFAHRKPRDTLVACEPYFYPLDRIGHWNRLYGARGFQQFQCVIPEAAAVEGIGALLDAVAASGSGSFLAVLKRCGSISSPGLLSFPMAGTSLALDFAQTNSLASLLSRLDAIVRDHGGRLYPAKDAHMTGADFRRAYPRWQAVEHYRDPAIHSSFWDRVTQ